MTHALLHWIEDDGGRAAAGYKGKTGDCACRALAIALGIPYQEAYDYINAAARDERRGKRKRGVSNARTGVYKCCMQRIMGAFGWRWTPTMHIGSGCTVHLRAGEVPATGRHIINLSKHYTTVIDNVIHDTYDPSRDGMRCVYGYWSKP